MDIKGIIRVLISNNIVKNICNYDQLAGEHKNKIWLIEKEDNKKIIVKISDEISIDNEVKFLDFYKEIEVFPNVIYHNSKKRLLCYEYIQGDIKLNIDSMELLRDIILITKAYKICDSDGYGYLKKLGDYRQFFMNSIFQSSKRIKTLIDYQDYMMVKHKIELITSEERHIDKYLLHGDFGINNCVFRNKKLVGVVNSASIVGEPIYDVIYALCSNIRFLSSIGVDNIYLALSDLGYSKDVINAYLIVVLYIRIGTCIKYDSYDLQDYLKFWEDNFSNSNKLVLK